jgi:hypothetical protein
MIPAKAHNCILTLVLLLANSGPRAVIKEPKPDGRSFSGFLMDLACARERKEKEPDLGQQHTRKCMEMPVCTHSGFGLLTDTNELLPFDEAGNRKVRMLLERTSQGENLRVVVQGTRTHDTLQVRKIELRKQ